MLIWEEPRDGSFYNTEAYRVERNQKACVEALESAIDNTGVGITQALTAFQQASYANSSSLTAAIVDLRVTIETLVPKAGEPLPVLERAYVTIALKERAATQKAVRDLLEDIPLIGVIDVAVVRKALEAIVDE